MTTESWEEFDETRPAEPAYYEWLHLHEMGFHQRFFAKMRNRGAGYREVLSPEFDYWDGYRVHVPKGMKWRVADDQALAEKKNRKNTVIITEIDLRPCPFCGTNASIYAAQCGYPGGGGGQLFAPSPLKYNTWRVDQCCGLIGFNGFSDPMKLAEAWNGKSDDQ